ncbi:hypothetical protein Q6A66_07680 [Helicobacter pylori]|nr:hypothetical protein [Helicobacter pylori]MDO7814061.1 hypothetical protein [Helicobacter pylori]
MAIRFGVIFIVDFLRAISVDDKNKQFGIIFIVGDPDNKTKKLKSCFCSDKNSRFSYFPIITEDYLILDNLKGCFVFQCEPNKNDRPFNLKQYLLGLKVNLGFEPTGIFYCENANTHKIELISNDSDFKGVLLEFSQITSLSPNDLPQFLANFKNSKSPNEKISFNFTSNKNSSISLYAAFNRKVRDTLDCYCWHGYSKIPQEKRMAKIQEQVNEEIKLDPSFCNHRVSSEQNRKINEIAEGLKSGKIIGEKIIANAFDLNAGYCFITPNDLKNLLKERLLIQQDIINAINQRVVLNHAQINDIKYNLLDNTFHFIFDVGNPLLKESSQLIIEVPREALDLENIDKLVECIMWSPYISYSSYLILVIVVI